MSLLPKQVMTPANLAAHQQNARRSQGPVTPEGMERLRAANLRHGFYSRKDGEALVALGEDPAELAALLASVMEVYPPKNAFELRLVKRLARALWRMERADRIQESQTVLRVEEARREAARAARQIHDELDLKLDTLKGLAAEVARPEHCTNLSHVDALQKFYGLEPKGRPGGILTLLYSLAGWGKEVGDMLLELTAVQVEPARREDERQECRTEIQELLAEEIAEVEAAQARARDDLWKFHSPFGYDALMAPQSIREGLMMRMEDSNFRQVCRIPRCWKSSGPLPLGKSAHRPRWVKR